MAEEAHAVRPGIHAALLVGITILFGLRVLAQFVALRYPEVSALPPFDAWQSGVIPYSVLLTAQLAILGVLGRASWQLACGRAAPNPGLARPLLISGGVYLAAMLLRGALGLTLYVGHPWFDRPLPTVFHLVLATAVLVLGAFHALAAGEGGNREH